MINRLEDLWSSAAADGASAPLGPLRPHDDSDIDELLDAWFAERKTTIEFEMLLGQSRRMIAHALESGFLAPSQSKKAARLLREIDRSLKKAPSDPA
jgi:hypothetical protein